MSRFPDLKKMSKQFNSLPPGEQYISFLDTAANSFRTAYKITKPGLRKHGYRDLSMIDKENDSKVFAPAKKTSLTVVYGEIRTIPEFRGIPGCRKGT